ncbi:hypothetical protein [Moraxella lacunata]|uniref:hypothetical protein n=1 Tax=Moraxella lacunata TaxID=477 RepID=UPI003EDEC838
MATAVFIDVSDETEHALQHEHGIFFDIVCGTAVLDFVFALLDELFNLKKYRAKVVKIRTRVSVSGIIRGI